MQSLLSVERILRQLEESDALFQHMERNLQANLLQDIDFLLLDFPELPDDETLPNFAETKLEVLHQKISAKQAELSMIQQAILSTHPNVTFCCHEELPLDDMYMATGLYNMLQLLCTIQKAVLI